MEKKTGKKLSKFMSKLGSLVHKPKPVCSNIDYQLPAMPGLSPLSAANNPLSRKKQQQLSVGACRAQDDCNQILASSDQASQVARIEEQPQGSYASEHYGSECSFSESVRAASAHMAQLRTILVNHISETHDARSTNGELAGPNLLAALHREQQHCSSSVEHLSGFSGRRSTSSRLPAGSASTDRRVEALLADQMQLLDLVQTLIADHRNSLLEQQRLQQQLAATQEALHSERLDKDRAAALAHVRSEEVSKVQADLAAASEAVQQLRAKRAISIKQVLLPSALSAAAAGGLNAEESILSDAAEKAPAGAVACVKPGHTPSRTSATIGRIAPEDSWQDMTAIVGPAPVSSSQGPLSAGAAAAAPLALNNSKASSSSRQRQSSKHRSSKTARISGGKAGSSSRVRNRNADLQAPREPRQRRLLGDTPSSSSRSGDAAGSVTVAAAPVAENAPAMSERMLNRDSSSSQASLQSPGDASVYGQVVQQQQQKQQQQQQPVQATAASAAARIAQKQAAVLELLLLQRLNHQPEATCPMNVSAQLRQLLCNSIETETSSLSVAWTGAAEDVAAAAAGLTKQQLHQLLHRPWLPNGSQGSQAGILSPQQSAAQFHAGTSAARVLAAGDVAGASAGTSTAAAACTATRAEAGAKRKQWQLPANNTRMQAAAAGSEPAGCDDTNNCSSVEQDSASDSDIESDGEIIESGSDSDACSRSDDGVDGDHESDGSSTSRSDASSRSSSDCSSMEDVEHQSGANRAVGNSSRAAAGACATAGGRLQQQQQQQHIASSSSVSQKHGGNVHSSNGSSWPAMKASIFASNSNGATLAAMQQGTKPSPPPCKRTQKLSNRSRSQPVQISTSLESAETLSLATTATVQHGPGSRSASHSSSLATATAVAACPRCSTDAACSCFAAVSGTGRGWGSRGSGVGSSSSGRMAAKRSAELLQRGSDENQGTSTYKRKLAPGAAAVAASHQQAAGAAAAAAAGASRQRQRVTQQQQQQQQAANTSTVLQANAKLSSQPSRPTASQAAGADNGCDSDGEMSVASAATGCTTLSNLAGIDLQIRSQVKPRPAIVPKLDLPLMAQQQQQKQQGVGMQVAAATEAAGASGTSGRGLRLAQESDMAPLMAQPGSSRMRGKNTPRSVLEAAGPAGSAAMQVERAGSSFTSSGAAGSGLGAGAVRAKSFTAGQQRQQQGAADAAAAAGQTAPSSPAHSTRSKRSSAPGSEKHPVTAATCSGGSGVAAARVGSANGSTGGAGHYWGSSAGSYPASEEPSRQPTPTGEFVVPIYVPAAAALPGSTHSAATGRTGAGAPGNLLSAAVAGRSGAVADADSAVAEADEAASAGSTSTAYGPAAQQIHHPVPATQQTAQMLTIPTPRGAALTPRGLTPSSAAAAAAGSYMTMRPAHMYKSVSTVYAMYSPLRGGLRAFGQTKPGASGLGTSAAGAVALNSEAAGQASSAEAFGVTAFEQHSQQLQQQVLGTAGMLGVREPSTGNASEHHWHALLGTVPEEEGVLYCEAVQGQLASAAAGDGHSSLGPAAAAAAAAGLAATNLAAPGVLADGRQGSLGTAAVLSSPSPISGGSDSEPYYYVPNAAGMPTRQDFQRMLQQEQQQQQCLAQQERQQQQQAQQQQADKDVVDRGPLFRPESISPPPAARAPAVRRNSATTSSRQQQQRSSLQQQRSSLTIQTATATVTEAESTAVGPLTASSPTRRRNNTSSSSSINAAAQSSHSEATVQQQQQQHRRHQQHSLRQPREHTMTHSREHGAANSRGRTSSSQDVGVSVAAVARVEAAAAAVAARVAAVAARQNSRREHNVVAEEELSSPDAAGGQASTAAAASSNNNQAEEQQQEQSSRPHRSSETRSRSASREQRQHVSSVKQRHRQQQQQLAGSGSCMNPNSRRHRRTSSGSSSRRTQAPELANNNNSSITSNLLDSWQASTEMVTSYHNPLVTLEDAGLGPDDDAALVYAGLVTGFTPGATRAAASQAAGVAAAAVNQVPAHVTPLAKERSREGGGSKDGCVAQEQSGARGQLHWNPLYDPDAMEISPIVGYAQ